MSKEPGEQTTLFQTYRTRFEKSLELLTEVPYTRERLALYSRKIIEILLEQVTENGRVNLERAKNPLYMDFWITQKRYKSSKKLKQLVAIFLQELAGIVLMTTNQDTKTQKNNAVFGLIVRDLGTWVNFWFVFVLHVFGHVQQTAERMNVHGVTFVPVASFLDTVEYSLREEGHLRFKFLAATYDFLLDKFGWEGIERKKREDFDASASSEVIALALKDDDEDLEKYRDTGEMRRVTVDIPFDQTRLGQQTPEQDSSGQNPPGQFEMPSDEIWALDGGLEDLFSDSDSEG